MHCYGSIHLPPKFVNEWDQKHERQQVGAGVKSMVSRFVTMCSTLFLIRHIKAMSVIYFSPLTAEGIHWPNPGLAKFESLIFDEV